MRYALIALMAGGLWASNMQLHPSVLQPKTDPEQYEAKTSTQPGRFHANSLPTTIIRDSARNQYTILYPSPEPIAVEWVDGNEYVAFTHRMFHSASSGYLKMHWTYDGMTHTTWYSDTMFDVDAGVYQGGSRYPNAHWSSSVPGVPVATFPELVDPPAWGMFTAVTVDTTGPYGVISDNIGVSSAPGRVMPDGNIVMAANDGTPDIWMAVYDPLNGTWLVEPEIVLTSHILNNIMYDPVNDVIYLGTLDYDNVVFGYYTATWDGSSLTVDNTFHQVDIPVDANYNTIWRGNWTLNYPDGGTTPRPSVLVPGSASGAEYAKVLYYGDGVNQVILPTVVSDLTDTMQAIMPEGHQITSEPMTGNLFAIWTQVDEWRADPTNDSGWAYYDFYYSISTDNGATWADPVNLTETDSMAWFCPKVPRHYWAGRIWLAYGDEEHYQIDPWWDAEASPYPAPLDGNPFYLYLTVLEGVGVNENSHPEQTFNYRMVGDNLVLNGLPTNARAQVEVYDIAGRQLLTGAGTGSVKMNLGELSTGTYLFRVQAGKFTGTGKVVVSH